MFSVVALGKPLGLGQAPPTHARAHTHPETPAIEAVTYKCCILYKSCTAEIMLCATSSIHRNHGPAVNARGKSIWFTSSLQPSGVGLLSSALTFGDCTLLLFRIRWIVIILAGYISPWKLGRLCCGPLHRCYCLFCSRVTPISRRSAGFAQTCPALCETLDYLSVFYCLI
jgi:hypothetical protein